MEEGIALIKYGLDPYQGDIVHEPPLNILVYSVLSQYSTYAFIVLDVVTALVNNVLCCDWLVTGHVTFILYYYTILQLVNTLIKYDRQVTIPSYYYMTDRYVSTCI